LGLNIPNAYGKNDVVSILVLQRYLALDYSSFKVRSTCRDGREHGGRNPKSSTGHLTVETNLKFKTQMTETSIATNPVRLFLIFDFGHSYLFRPDAPGFGFRI
jgi:hypothetical protein